MVKKSDTDSSRKIQLAKFWQEVRDCTRCDELGWLDVPGIAGNTTTERCPYHDWAAKLPGGKTPRLDQEADLADDNEFNANYPTEWTPEQRLMAYWYAQRNQRTIRSQEDWQAILVAAKAEAAERQQMRTPNLEPEMPPDPWAQGEPPW